MEYFQDLYVGGTFHQAGGIAVNNIAKWDGSNWSDLNGGTTTTGGYAYVNALTTVNDDLYAGGHFTTAGDKEAQNIAQWSASRKTWKPLNGGVNNAVTTLTTMGNTLYAGGWFDTAYNSSTIAVNEIAMFSNNRLINLIFISSLC